MKFVLKLIVVSEVVSSIIKLTQDALKELIETNCCKYAYEVATHLKYLFVGQTCLDLIKIESWSQSFHQPAGREHPWVRR